MIRKHIDYLKLARELRNEGVSDSAAKKVEEKARIEIELPKHYLPHLTYKDYKIEITWRHVKID